MTDTTSVKCEQVLTADYEMSDEPLALDDVDGLYDAVKEVAETKEDVYLECDGRVADYKVYWNEKTETVRFAAYMAQASYEVPKEVIQND